MTKFQIEIRLHRVK